MTRAAMHVLVVAGARPNFMKVAPVLEALRVAGHRCTLVHTGQHYDARMSDTFFAELGLPTPDHHLGVGSDSHARQTAHIMERFEPVLLEARPDWLVVVGDVNSTLACALVAAKLRDTLATRIAHVEAGLRSRDPRMPEETNRILTDHVADLLLTPSHDARVNLRTEGLSATRIVFVGNVMIDALRAHLAAARARALHHTLGVARGDYAVVTMHRPSNVDDPATLRILLEALRDLAQRRPVVLPLHPRTRRNVEGFGLAPLLAPLHVLDPLGYVDMLSLTDGAAVVATDSGGLQEETTALGVPCVTLREQTERPITVTHGTNRLVPWPPTVRGIVEACERAIGQRSATATRVPTGWDGHAARRIVRALERASDAAPAVARPPRRRGRRAAVVGSDH